MHGPPGPPEDLNLRPSSIWPTKIADVLRWLGALRLPSAARLMRANVLIASATLLTSVLLARGLSPEGRGELATLVLWPTFLSQIALFGIPVYLSRETARRREDAAKNYRIGFAALALSSCLAAIVYFAIAAWAGLPAQSRLGLNIAMIATLIIPFSAWNALQVQMELGRTNLRAYNYARMSFTLAHLGLVALIWAFQSSEMVYYLWAFIVAAMLAAASTNVLVRSSLPRQDVREANRQTRLVEIFCRAWPFALSAGLIALATTADRIAVSLLFDARTMGLYVIALALSQVQSVVNEAISPLFFARLASKARIADIDPDWLGMRLRQSIFINGSVGTALILAAPVLVPAIYGKAYAGALDVVYILVPAMCIRCMMRPFEEILKGGNRPLRQSFAMLTMTVLFAVGAALAAWADTVQGVALALLLSSITGLAIIASFVARESGVSISKLLLPRPKDAFGLLLATQRLLKS